MKPYAPPPPPGAQPPPLWGSESHVRELLERIIDIDARKQTVRVDWFPTPEAFRDYFKANYGPTIAAYKFIGDDVERAAALDQELVDLARRFATDAGAMDWEYLLLTARRA